jgi:hypothetical protein
MLKTTLPEALGELPSPAPRDRLRIVTPLHDEPDDPAS